MNIINSFTDYQEALRFLLVLLNNTPKRMPSKYEALVTINHKMYPIASYWGVNQAIDDIVNNWSIQ
jgi:hypothetical protein